MSEYPPDEWKTCSINDFLGVNSLFCDGDWVESKDQDAEGVNKLIQLGDIGDGVFLNKSNRYMNDTQFSNLQCTELREGDILIARMPDPLGRACLFPKINQRCATVVDVAVLRSPTANRFWLMYMINSNHIRRQIELLSAGTTRTRISRTLLADIVFFTPNRSIQQKIAQILQTVDQAIEKTEALIEKYQKIKTGLMHDLFTRGITADGKLRPSREHAPDLYQETPIGWIPKEWEFTKMGKYIERNLYGPRFDAGDYSDNGNVRTIRGTDFTKDGDILYDQAPLASLPFVKIQRHILKSGDVVIVTTADCGLTAVFEDQDDDFIPSAYAVKYRFSDSILPYFIKYFMQTNFAQRQVNKYVRQGTLGNLPGSDLLRFDIAIPNKNEQLRIIERIEAVQSKIVIEKRILLKLRHKKLGLMHDLLTGKVHVKIDEE